MIWNIIPSQQKMEYNSNNSLAPACEHAKRCELQISLLAVNRSRKREEMSDHGEGRSCAMTIEIFFEEGLIRMTDDAVTNTSDFSPIHGITIDNGFVERVCEAAGEWGLFSDWDAGPNRTEFECKIRDCLIEAARGDARD